jgi:hypothetical protein
MAEQQVWNPVPELKQKYPGLKDWTDEKIYNNLSDPNKFRSAFPQYANLGDDVIKRNIDRLKTSTQQTAQAAPVADMSRVNQPFSAEDAARFYNQTPAQKPPAQPPAELKPWTPTPIEKAGIWFRNTQTGKTLANSFDDIRRGASAIWEKAQNPLGRTDEEWKNLKEKQEKFIDEYVPATVDAANLMYGTPTGDKIKSIAKGGAKGTVQFGEELTSPVQIGLMVGTFGESALAQTAARIGLPRLVPAARVMGKLIQAQFISQMVEGSYINIRDAVKGYISGDWDTATQQAVNGLGSLLMAKAGISHVDATERVQSDLNKMSLATMGKKFDKLSPETQGLVIDQTVSSSPEYIAMMATVDAKNAEVADGIRQKRQMQAAHYAGLAWEQAWHPEAAQRAVNALHEQRAETARKEQVQKVIGTIKAKVDQRTEELKKQTEESAQFLGARDTAIQEARAQERKEAAASREAIQQTAEEISKGREETFASRQAVGQVPTEAETWRPVESEVDGSGHVTYPAQFWGETNRFGVGTDGERHSVYRQTPRGVEWLDRNGNFTETPESLYFNADPQTSDTVARLSSLKLAADGLAAQPEATAEEVKEAATLGEIRQQLIDGEINTGEAQKRAGIAEKTTLPDVFMAAREGRLNGPFSEKSANDYASEVEATLRESGASEEEVQATLESLPELARVQIESNLHHVYQPGDYITSKKGVKWTLDAKGILHSSDGETVPLMKRGTYSNQAMQLAASGKVGYGTKTRLERRADFSRNRDIKRQIGVRQEEFDREMRVAQQNAGLEESTITQERADEGEKAERRKEFLARPPVPEETSKAREQRRATYKASNDPNNIINQLAKQFGTTPDEVMRIGLSESQPGTPQGKAASLEVGDRISDPFRPDRPWIVEEKNGKVYLRSGQANPIPFDRLNPSPRVLQILEKGEITHDRDWTAEEKEKVAFEKPYLVHRKFLVDGVRDRMEGKVKDPEPKTQVQAETQAAAADSRKAAAHKEAVKAVEEASNPEISRDETPERAVAKAEQLATAAEDAKKVAKEAVAQSAEARAKAGPKGDFPGRSPISIHLRGKDTIIDQNQRQVKAHYELVPAGAVILSHHWEGDNLVRTDDNLFPKQLQPREPNERTILQRRLDAQRYAVSEDGRTSGYNFEKFANRTIDAMSGPPLVEPGGRTVSGNGRLQRLLKHLQVLNEIADPVERAAAVEELKSKMAALAKENGIGKYPDDGQFYIVVRMMDDPIQTIEEATKYGLLFNESEADNISDAQKGLVYGRSLDQDAVNKIGRLVEESEGGLNAAMRDNPLQFAEIAAARFDIPTSQQSLWFMKDKMGNDVLTEQGERLFRKAVVGHALQDPDLLTGIENETAGRALENAIGYVTRLNVFPELDITEPIREALQAAKLTVNVDPDRAVSRDRWDAVYSPSQIDLTGMEQEVPPEPGRVVESLWRALHSSQAANPRAFGDRLKNWISDEDTQGGMFDSAEKSLEKPVDKFNRVFSKELRDTAFRRNKGTDKAKTDAGWMLSQAEYDAALQGRDVPDEERVEEKKPEEIRAGKIGDMLGAGEVVSTATGRKTTPFPKLDTDSNRKAQNTVKRVDQWLMENAIEEARARGDEFNLRQFEQNKAKPSPADKDSAEMYLFDKESVQPIRKSILKSLGPPPQTASPEDIFKRDIAAEIAANGHISPGTYRKMLHFFEATKENAETIYDTSKALAEARWERRKPEGVEHKNALAWVLKEIGFKGIEKGNDSRHRGEYVFAEGIMRLNEAADKTTAIHEFIHAISPLIDEEEWKQIDTIKVNKAAYKREYGRDWDYTGQNERMEKLAYGSEKFLRDENAVDFQPGFELRKVLKDIKEMFISVYRKLQSDPLSPFKLSDDFRQWMADNFGITGFNVADDWREKLKKARAQEKKIVRPEDQPHPVVKLARELGGTGLRDSIDGKVVDEVGDRVDPKKPSVIITFSSEGDASAAIGSDKIKGGQIIEGKDGTWGVKINTTSKVPKGSLFQGLPERHPGLQLEDLEKRLKETPSYKTFERRLLQMQIDNMRNRIRADHGVEPLAPKTEPELPKQVIQEAKNAKTADRGRAANDGPTKLSEPPRVGGIPQPPKLGVSGYAGAKRGGATARGSVPRAPVNLENVKPVNLEPLAGVRGEPVGTTAGEKFDQKAWVEGLKKAGLPESTPAPTYSLDPKVAAQLIYPGQKQIVQTVMSGLDQGDGVAVVTPPGTGKTYLGNAVIKEFLRNKPDASVLIVSKNKGLIRKSKRVAASTFGFDVELDVPEGQPGVYGASYKGLLDNDIYKNSKWDLVVADEAGEARRWYDDTTQQGQMLRDVVANSGKAVYMSATPFHSPQEYGYLDKLNLWPKGQFDKWIQENFAHEKVGDKIVARLDPGKQAKLREQLIERGQFVSQAISYDGYNAHFGVVPVTDSMKRGLDRIREGFDRARDQFTRMGKQGLARKAAAFEAVYTKNFLERERLPQAIELAKQARDQGWRVLFFSEHTADDLFRRERSEGEEASTYQQLDDAMGGQLSRIIPAYPSIYNELYAEFGAQVGDYSGRGNTDAAREKARTDFLKGEVPMLYASYAGGGIGVDMHDADYPELNVKGGDKPIVAIYLGPPYSGVLLEQAMGRPWRFGVKSDVHAVFLATDSEPDIRLMQTKVGPRMKALRAAVLGEKDSLANVMSTYTDEEKVRERQDQLAYAEGNEMKVNATQFQVRSKQRNVGIQDWSAISFPSAEEAKHKGMKYGEAVAGGDWSSLYQSKFELRPPDSPEDARAKNEIDRLGNAVASGRAVPAELQNLESTEVKTAVGLSAATATTETDLPLDRDKTNTARQSMDSQLRSGRPFPYYGLILSQELGMENIARRAGKPEVGKNLKLMNRNYRADYDVARSQYWNLMEDTFKRNGIKTDDKKAVWTITRVLEGQEKETSADPRINAIAADLSDMMRMAHEDLSKSGVGVRDHTGKIVARYGKDFGEDPKYYPHRINWDQEVTDPKTGKKLDLREMMKEKNEEIRKRIIANIPELKPYTYQQVYEYLNRHTPKAPVLSNIHRAREVNFPYIKRDYPTLVGYFDQVAEATAQARNFGPENQKLNTEIRKINDINGIETLQSMFRSTLEPQNWNDITAKIYNAAIAYEAASKMTYSAFKIPFHLGLVPIGMHGKVLPLAKAFAHLAIHPREVMENAGYVGVLTRQLSAADIVFGERQAAPVRQILRKEMFEASYKMVRALSGESARVYLDQYAIKELKRGGRDAENTRRLLSDTFLIGNGSIDDAVASGRFSPGDIGRAQTAFANLTTFSDDPLQMPQLARHEIAKGASKPAIGLFRAVRLTYALESFTLKATSLLREQLYEEVVVHHNYKPLAYALVASPILGQMLAATGAGAKHVIHKGFEGLTGHKHEKDSWDTYIENLKQTFEHPEAAELLKFIVDGYTLAYGWDMVRSVTNPFLDLAAGELKKAGKGFEYMVPDLVEHIAGSFYDDLFKTAEELARIGQIESGRRMPLKKPEKIKQSVGKYLEGQVPALRQFPPFESVMGIKPPPR